MIHKIIEAAKHAELLRRVEEELDSIAKEIAEPNIHIHWPIIQNPVQTSIKVHFRYFKLISTIYNEFVKCCWL